MKSYNVLGLMSGTSLDGLDVAFCRFGQMASEWSYEIIVAETLPYSGQWVSRLSGLENANAPDFVRTDIEYGHLLGEMTRDFIQRHSIHPDFIASHGQTIFHQPENRMTSQIGRGSCIAAETGLPVVSDFRSLDVALGGQGAPLVPIGDQMLFGESSWCLNIGGFANISHPSGSRRIAYDIVPANIVLNYLSEKKGMSYDKNGDLARRGIVDPTLLTLLNSLFYYRKEAPKSLGKEWVLANIHPLLSASGLSTEDQLATFCEHIAFQIGQAACESCDDQILITGGGAHNSYLTGRIHHYLGPRMLIPDQLTIDFKEALIFAFLGLLRWLQKKNCLRSVTGARMDSSGGAIYHP
jgi:anhydro-N-acetylmuramic acid kinase